MFSVLKLGIAQREDFCWRNFASMEIWKKKKYKPKTPVLEIALLTLHFYCKK